MARAKFEETLLLAAGGDAPAARTARRTLLCGHYPDPATASRAVAVLNAYNVPRSGLEVVAVRFTGARGWDVMTRAGAEAAGLHPPGRAGL